MLEKYLIQSQNCTLESDAFWIGANDALTENHFQWVNGHPVEFEYWFPGWHGNGHLNKQPSDDGFSNEDCVEIRRIFHNLNKGTSVAEHFFWNDRKCNTRNPYICQISKFDDDQSTVLPPTVQSYMFYLNSSQPDVMIKSPGFPEHYPMLSDINYTIIVPTGYNVAVRFNHFNIESSDSTEEHKTTCGDWNTKLKKMTWVSETNIAVLRFRSDKSIYRSGFSLKASIYKYDNCDSLNGTAFYLRPATCIQPFLTEVSYQKAIDWCAGLEANLLLNLSVTAAYLISNFAVMSKNQAVNANESIFIWSNTDTKYKGDACEVMQITPGRGTVQPRISVQTVQCEIKASFVCAESILETKIQETTVNCTSYTGEISMIKDESIHYNNNRIKHFQFQAPKYHRIVLEITFLDLEFQSNCLYDALIFRGFKNVTSLCGNMTYNVPKYYISLSNNASITFKTDESVLGHGFHFKWIYVNTINCFDVQSYGSFGIIKSFNFLIPFMDEHFCCSDINTPTGSRLILHVVYSRFSAENSCVSVIFTPDGKSKQFCGHKHFRYGSETIISSNNSINLCLHSKQLLHKDGFQGNYYIDYSPTPTIVAAKQLQPNSSGEIVSPHYPDFPPLNIVQITSLAAPIGYRIDLNMSTYVLKVNGNCSLSTVEIIDETLGKFNTIALKNSSCTSGGQEQVVIQSNLNKLKIIFKVDEENADRSLTKYSATFSVKPDIDYLLKTNRYPNTPFAKCSNTSCLNGGYCQNVSTEEYICNCPVHFTGMFCQVSWCDLPVCIHGTCILDHDGYSCDCYKDYWGQNCDITSAACAAMVCSGNGVCIEDAISGKPCSCNKEWTGRNCSFFEKPLISTQSKRTLMDEPIWIGMITVLILLILFGLLLLARRRCSRYFKCCEDTDEILKKQAENAIPAHKNYTPSTQGTPTGTSTSALKFKFEEEDSSNFLKVESQNDMEPFHTPPIDVENFGAAVRLFDAYNSKSEKRCAEKQHSILGYENQQSSGIVDGTLQFLQLDTEVLSSDNETYSKFMPFSNPELRKSLSSLPISQKERTSTFVKSNSVQADFSSATHCYPHIVIVNDTSYENLDDAGLFAENDDIPKMTRERKKSIQRQKTLDDLDAQKKREVFASKSKTSSTMLDIPPFESHLAQRRLKCNHELARRSPSITPTSFESDPTYRYNRRHRLKSAADSSEDEIDRFMNRSFCSQPDRLQEMVNECKCCGIERVRPKRSKYLRMSRKKSQQHTHSVTSERSSSCEKRRHRRHPRVSSLNDVGYHKRDPVSRHALSIPYENSESAKRVSLHIMEENQIDNDEYRKMPVRKSRSNDLNLNKTPSANQVSDDGSPFRKRSHSFHSETSDTKKNRNPDDLLNNDQKAGPSFYLGNENQEQEKSKTLEHSTTDLAVVSTSSALSVTDTDTGFSSSSPWRETTDENVAEKLRIHSLKDSAYQTKQSSVERHPYEGPKNSYENPDDIKINDRIDMTNKLQQAAKRLIMYEKNSQFSKDSAFTNTFSETEDTDSDKSPRELHPPLRPRTSNFSLHPKLYPLEQVSEEGDSHTPESATINDDTNTQSLFTEDIEMKEFVV
ncbi:unnamed protein product [Mytilus coruscus]|uniref:Uncharacterized protein n=1 Tax=Mytilus coruscus TaxID=42192 RepID=A0A6J7ZUI2_MYTCO|nr:unnamed protein product [Mytilus coruscus]